MSKDNLKYCTIKVDRDDIDKFRDVVKSFNTSIKGRVRELMIYDLMCYIESKKSEKKNLNNENGDD